MKKVLIFSFVLTLSSGINPAFAFVVVSPNISIVDTGGGGGANAGGGEISPPCWYMGHKC